MIDPDSIVLPSYLIIMLVVTLFILGLLTQQKGPPEGGQEGVLETRMKTTEREALTLRQCE